MYRDAGRRRALFELRAPTPSIPDLQQIARRCFPGSAGDPCQDTIKEISGLVKGKCSYLPEVGFRLVGTIEQTVENGKMFVAEAG
jgi:hypothetical protein